MKLINKNIIGILLITLFAACGSTTSSVGGTEAGNPSTRTMSGTLTSSSASVNQLSYATSCPADTVIATNSLAETTSATVDSNCGFSLSLAINTAYSISFFLNDAFVANMAFTNSAGALASNTIYIASGDTAITLGIISISGSSASPENEPAEQNDTDGDGINDFDDDDDDGDGLDDDEETDCDLDGYFDDDDEDDDSCDDGEETSSPQVLQAEPQSGETNVETEEEIEIRTGCSLDTSTVTSTTFSVVATGDTVSCDYTFSSDDENVKCEHDDDLLTETTYTVTIEGVKCANGETVATTSWTFITEDDE